MILGLVHRLRIETNIPLLLMTYYNPVLQYGLDSFAGDAVEAGVDGIIVPDLPLEESAPLQEVLKPVGMHLIYLVAPTTPPERLRKISTVASGFIYCVSRTGVTGMRDSISPDTVEFIQRVRQHCTLPLAVGFGVSNPEQASLVAKYADAVIVGSAVVSLIEQFSEQQDVLVKRTAKLLKSFKDALSS